MSIEDEIWTPELQSLADELAERAKLTVATLDKNFENGIYSGDAGDETEWQ